MRVDGIGGRFVGGEARALVRFLDGGPALPPGRRDHLTARGVLVANAETFAQTAVLLRLGARGFADTGTRTEPGTVLLTVGGAVARPGVVEIPLGTPLGIVLQAAGAGTSVRSSPAATTARGWHRSPTSRSRGAGLAAAGGSLGAGVLLAVDAATCALGELRRVTRLAGRAVGGPVRAVPVRPARPRRRRPRAGARRSRAASTTRYGTRDVVDGRGACSPPGRHRPLRRLGAARPAGRARTSTAPAAAAVRCSAGCRWVRHDRAHVDWTRCDGHGLCAALLPTGSPVTTGDSRSSPAPTSAAGRAQDVRRVVAVCPALALRLSAR